MNKKVLSSAAGLLLTSRVFCNEAQDGLSELQRNFSVAEKSAWGIAQYSMAAVLAVGLVFVVWHLATGSGEGKKYLISWFVALVFCAILNSLLS